MTKVELENRVMAWSMSSAQYVKAAVGNVETNLAKRNLKLPKRASAPFPNDYRSELNISVELDLEKTSYYQSLIGILRWIVESGRTDTACKIFYHSFVYGNVKERPS